MTKTYQADAMYQYRFNPHFRKGSDSLPMPGLRDIRVSIHTSAREVTKCHDCKLFWIPVSIHTSAREVTFAVGINSSLAHSFNPHFRKGSDSNISQKTFPVFMKHYQIHLNLLPHIPSNILSMQKHTQICLFFLVRVVR